MLGPPVDAGLGGRYRGVVAGQGVRTTGNLLCFVIFAMLRFTLAVTAEPGRHTGFFITELLIFNSVLVPGIAAEPGGSAGIFGTGLRYLRRPEFDQNLIARPSACRHSRT